MKKRILNLLFFGVVASFASAQTLTVADVEVMKGKTASFELNVNVDGNNYTGLQFSMKFPEKFAVTKNSELLASWEKGDIMVGALNEDGEGNVSCMTTKNTSFIPDGKLGTIEFSTEAEVGVYDVTLSKVTFMTSTERKEVADVTFKVSVVNAITLDENSTTAPSAATDVNVKVKRTFTGGKWSTLCLPFDMSAAQVTAAFGTGVKLGDFVKYTSEFDEEDNLVAIAVQFDEVDNIEANRPCIINVPNDMTEFTVEGVTIAPEEAFVEYNNGKTGSRKEVYGTFDGTYVAGTALAPNALFLSEGKFWYATSSTKSMKAFRASFNFVDALSSVSPSRYYITFDDITGIKSLKTDGEEEVYTLSGQRVNKAGKGVYIVNGKKVIKK
jgi:hypothetical protein